MKKIGIVGGMLALAAISLWLWSQPAPSNAHEEELSFRNADADRPWAERSRGTMTLQDASDILFSTPEAPRTLAVESEVEPTTQGPPSDAADLLLKGHVHNVAGGIVTGDRLRARFVDASGVEIVPDIDMNGALYQRGLHAGRWTLSLLSNDFRPLVRTVDMSEEDPVRWIDLDLVHTDEILVRFVTERGGDLAAALESEGLRITIVPVQTREPPGATVTTLQTLFAAGTSKGSFIVLDPAQIATTSTGVRAHGVLRLNEPLPGYISATLGRRVLQTQLVAAGAEEVVFVLAMDVLRATLATARLRVVDAQSGIAIAGIHVVIDDRFESSDAHGDVVFHGLVPGAHKILIRAPGTEALGGEIRLRPGEQDLGELRIGAATFVQGRVIDERGNPARIPVEAIALDEDSSIDWRSAPRHRSSETEEKLAPGEFKIEALGRRKYAIRASDVLWGAPAFVADTSDGPVTGLLIRVTQCKPVTIDLAGPLRLDVSLSIIDAIGLPALELDRMVSPSRIEFTLTPGNYTLTGEVDDTPLRATPFQVVGEIVVVRVGS